MYASYYVQLAGYSASTSFKVSIGITALSLAGNITSWFLVDRFGRRDLSLYGVFSVTAIMIIIGGLGTQTTNVSCIKAIIALDFIYSYIYNFTIGATAYNLLAEVATSRLRAKTASIGLALQNALYVSGWHSSLFNFWGISY
jgi:MFS transporter, SP family, general alpha glucoside:H+ symporter